MFAEKTSTALSRTKKIHNRIVLVGQRSEWSRKFDGAERRNKNTLRTLKRFFEAWLMNQFLTLPNRFSDSALTSGAERRNKN